MDLGGTALPMRIVLIFAAFVGVSADSHTTACSSDLTSPACLTAARQLMADGNKFWFGSSYAAVCSFPGADFVSTCTNYDKAHLSIATRMRESSDNSVDMITQVLNVTYDAPAGSYESCGQTYPVDAVKLTLDPLVSTNMALWSADFRPTVSWLAEPNKVYSLIVWDAGAHKLHGVFYNIIGDNLQNSQVSRNYRGPKNPVNRDQPYVFLLYEQAAMLNPQNATAATIAVLNVQTAVVTPAPLVNLFSLTGPIGVSILSIKTDPYSTEYFKKNRIANNCPALLTPSFSALHLSYNVSAVTLKSSVDVTFKSPETSFTYCCKTASFASNSRMTNPIGNGHIAPVYTRHAPSVTLAPTNMFDAFYYMRQFQTLLLLDVTEELAMTPNPDTLLHWQVLNFREANVRSGETTQSYKAPLPLAGGGDRVFMFLLLLHSTAVDASGVAQYAGTSCPQSLAGRCRFNLSAFIQDNAMTIDGASWFLTSPDAYSRHQAVTQGLQTESTACFGVQGFSSPCVADLCTVPAVNHTTACSSDLTSPACLTAVRQRMADEDHYWFGSSYAAACSFPGADFVSSCINYDKVYLSIATRLRKSSDNSVDTVTQVLNVTYDAPAGSYESCGQTYAVDAVKVTLDPLTTTSMALWSTEYRPTVRWRAEPNKIYSLIIWEAGLYKFHGIFYNIVGGSLQNSQVAYNYRGPKISAKRDQPYMFLLYEQAAMLNPMNVTEAIIAVINVPDGVVSPVPLVNLFSLSGPVGVSILSPKTDPYSTEFFKNSRIRNNCPAILTPSFSALPLSYNVRDVRLTSSVEVTFKSPEISISYCCQAATFASNSRMPNPLGNGHIAPVYTRHAPSISLIPTSPFDTFYYTRQFQTLLLLDVTQELAVIPNTLLHWQVLNFREGDVRSGETTQSYKAPLPLAGGGDRVFMFLLLLHSTAVDASGVAQYAGTSCPQSLAGRCRFNLAAFIQDNAMTIDGASWFLTSPDAYSRHQAVTQGLQPESAACLGVQGFSSPCGLCTATGGAPAGNSLPATLTLCLLGMLLVLITM